MGNNFNNNNNMNINNQNNSNQNSKDNEIMELKNKLIKANKIIEQQKLTINGLLNKLNSYNTNINNYQNIINQKDLELNNLRMQLNNMINNNQLNNFNVNFNNMNNNIQSNNMFCNINDIMSVNFISMDQTVHFSVGCLKTNTFAEVEEKLYRQYPQYRETNNNFLANGIQVLRFKTIAENKIGNGLPVTLVVPS